VGFTGWPAVAGATPITAEASTDCGWNQLVEAVNERIAVAQTRGYWGVALSPVAPGDPVNVVNMRVLRQVVEDLLWFYLDPETGNDWDYSLGKTGFLEMAIGQSDWTDPVLVGKSEETPGNPATPIRAAHVNEIRLAVQHLLWIYPSNPIDTTWRYTREGLDTFYDWDWDGSWDRARTAFEAASYVYSLTGSAATLIGQRSYDVPSWPPSRKNLINSKVCMRLIFTGTLDPAGIPVVAARMKFRYMRWTHHPRPGQPGRRVHCPRRCAHPAGRHLVLRRLRRRQPRLSVPGVQLRADCADRSRHAEAFRARAVPDTHAGVRLPVSGAICQAGF